MIVQTENKKNTIKRNVKRAAEIKYLLSINGYTQRQLAKELNLTTVWVNYFVQGKVNSPRIDNWLKENLGI